MPNLDTKTRKQRFLQAIECGSTVIRAADFTGVNPTEPYRWSQKDPEFAAARKAARDSRLARVKDTAFDLAMRGNVQLIKFIIARYEGASEKEPPQPIVTQHTILPAASLSQEIDGATHDSPASSLITDTTARG